MTGIATNKTIQVIAVIILCLLAVVFLVQTYGKATREIGYDFTSYLMSARALVHGGNPYTTGSAFHYIYPLFLAFALIPLTVVPYVVAVVIWYLIAVGSLLWSAKFIVEIAGTESGIHWDRRLLVPLTGVALLLIPVIQSNLLNGQVNFLVLLLSVLFLRFHLKDRMFLAALFLALAMAIKLFPAVLLLFVLLRKRYGECLLAIGLTAALCLLPALLMGREGFEVVRWYGQTVLGGMHARVAMTQAGRQFFSLSGVVFKAIPGLAGAAWLPLVAAAIVASALVAVQLGLRRWYSNARTALLYCVYLLAIPLLSPLSETHHLTFMIPAAIVLVILPSAPDDSKRLRLLLPALYFVLFWAGKTADSGFFFFAAIVYAFVVLTRMATLIRPDTA